MRYVGAINIYQSFSIITGSTMYGMALSKAFDYFENTESLAGRGKYILLFKSPNMCKNLDYNYKLKTQLKTR